MDLTTNVPANIIIRLTLVLPLALYPAIRGKRLPCTFNASLMIGAQIRGVVFRLSHDVDVCVTVDLDGM